MKRFKWSLVAVALVIASVSFMPDIDADERARAGRRSGSAISTPAS